MILRSPYRYVAQATARDGRPLGDLALDVDFGPAAECAHLHGVRAGELPATAHHGPCTVEPVYDTTQGHPFVQGVNVTFDAASTTHPPCVIPWTYFQEAVEQAAPRLVEARSLASGETFSYRICAFPHAVPQPGAIPTPAADDEDAVALTLAKGDVHELLSSAAKLGEAAWNAADVPVLVHAGVLEEATQMARAAGEREIGGILVGNALRTGDDPEIHVEITAQIPAVHARAGRARLGFTPESWSAMRDALALRKRNELMLGWWHFHPHWCRHCPMGQRERCALAHPFFSRDDCELHRTVFDAAFHVALLLSDTGRAQLSYDVFGWRDGRIAARGAHLVTAASDAPAVPLIGGATERAARILTVREKEHEH